MKQNKHVKAFTAAHIKPNENVLAYAEGYIGEMMGSGDKKQHNGSLIVTEQRVCFYRKGILGEVLETMPVKSITSIERKSVLGHRTIVIHTSNDELSFKTLKKDEEASVHDAIERVRDSVSKPVNENTAVSNDPFEKLKKLKNLNEQGILSDDEFEAKKAELMKSI